MATRPNILLITSDQQHYDTLGVVNPRIRTPSLDGLCAQGTRFDRAYCPNPTCTPTRASIITGLYPSTHGAWTLGTKLSEEVPTVGDAFLVHGYATTLIGKAHFQPLAETPEQTSLERQPLLRDLDFWRDFRGPWYGFETVEMTRNHADESHVGQHYALWLEAQGLTNWRDYFAPYPKRDGVPERQHSWDLPEELHYSAWTAERTIAALERDVARGQPFFTWASFHDPHPPYLVPEPWASMYDPDEVQPGTLEPGEFDRLPPHYALTQETQPDFSAYRETPQANHGLRSHVRDGGPNGSPLTLERQRRNMAVYYGMISLMDRHIGRILGALERLGVAENTLVVFTTDHGHFLGQHGLWHKGPFHYEDLLRLPFVVRYPGHVAAGRVHAGLQSLVDLAPTFLAAAGAPVPGAMQGVDQLPAWTGRVPAVRDGVIVENRHQPTKVHLRTYITDRYKLTLYRDHPYGELFDLEADLHERHNRWDDPAYAGVKGDLMHRFLNEELRREPTRYPRIAMA